MQTDIESTKTPSIVVAATTPAELIITCIDSKYRNCYREQTYAIRSCAFLNFADLETLRRMGFFINGQVFTIKSSPAVDKTKADFYDRITPSGYYKYTENQKEYTRRFYDYIIVAAVDSSD